ncbi:hypothetical protein EJ05DRAFT_473173 [Pseudovirgaria hyperparasitica]|uniref:Spo7-domain-containing protein n=1 Tax=Pseudovirgaria hyperparasitica TaxID=470096 RepID=A0A6A6WJA9_9PEZI|nr:uncharacterized protein EJ05DRAFT_473173 [Pseudovirgaria hyperparasitica]KAF2762256.1 hypothetical protein EJ05DRAFT_473173 [Pseudovirgaria hyperparasitica]
MSDATLDQVVKGAPPPSNSPVHHANLAASQNERLAAIKTPRNPVSDPTSLLPSAPSQIYLNLLILEASLRSQYLSLRARRRINTFVLILLMLWITGFSYLLFLRPREDGQGVGGSVYWVVDMAEKVAWIGGVVLGVLFWGAGQWERGVRWPRRWVGVTNRGLRGMNCKIVVMKGPWWREALSYISFIVPVHLFFPSPGSSYHLIDHAESQKHEGIARHTFRDHGHQYIEEDIAPGGDHIRLILLPKPFSPEFRENWELYRLEFWERENERRAELRKVVKQRDRELAKQEGGWLWWTGWRGWHRAKKPNYEKSFVPTNIHSLSHLKDKKRRPSVIRERERDVSHSRSSSRSSVAAFDDDRPDRPGRQEARERRWSNSTAGSTEGRRRKRAVSGASGLSNSTRPSRLTPTNSRPTTPTDQPPPQTLSKRASTLSNASSSSDGSKYNEKLPGRAPAA